MHGKENAKKIYTVYIFLHMTTELIRKQISTNFILLMALEYALKKKEQRQQITAWKAKGIDS